MTKVQRIRLRNFLEQRLVRCDHTCHWCRVFCAIEGLNPRRYLPWLQARGGFCDCEVLMNAL